MTTPLAVVLPANKDVKDMLTGLVGKPVAVAPGDDLPGDIAGSLAAFNRLDLAIHVPGYGKGGLSLVIP